ncbi:MAG TPA: hypothetical protein VHN20_14765, partial [Beijerinckiaceae bacterium]|nr:hypothetical protein [Beijerinckiaceae bacterium]
MLTTLIIAIGILAVLALGYKALSGPSAGRSYKRRLELLRERHGDAVTASAQAQIRKLFASRQTKVDDALSSFMPRPALLRRRLERTGKDIGLPKYVAIMGGLFAVTITLLLAKGTPLLLALLVGLLVGIGIPHFSISFLIKKRIAKFNSNFPDAIELMVRGLR